MRILVVEDDSLLAQGLTRVLARAGHAVDRAETGVQADRALRAASYDLVVLDIGQPDVEHDQIVGRCAQRLVRLHARVGLIDRMTGSGQHPCQPLREQ